MASTLKPIGNQSTSIHYRKEEPRDGLVAPGFISTSYERIGNISYAKYHYKENAERIENKNWIPLQKINDLYYPLGHVSDKDDFVVRVLGYLPIFALYTGALDMVNSIEMIYRRVIKNENSFNVKVKTQDDDKHFITITRHIHPVNLNPRERAAILGLGLALFIRGLITFCQIGIVFLPLDFIFNAYVGREKAVNKS